MKVLVLGDNNNLAEFRKKFSGLQYTEYRTLDSFSMDPHDDYVIFDFFLEENPENLELYASNENLTIFGNVVKSSLAELVYYSEGVRCKLFGFNGLPTFVNRDILEVSLLNERNLKTLERVCRDIDTSFRIVDDRVGMVTPRIICMIINEAYYMLQEGIAGMEDIDQAMKLGTNYPMGPFEWSKKIGINHIFELLEALYEDTHDERYKVCPLIKKEYLLRP